MEAKKIILNGGVIKFPYKTKRKEWLGEAYMHLFILEDKIKIIVSIPDNNFIRGGIKRYSIDNLDEAINDFFNFICKKENLAYKMTEAQIELLQEGIIGDLEDEKFYKQVMQKRKELINMIP